MSASRFASERLVVLEQKSVRNGERRMTIDQTNVVDFLGFDPSTDEVLLLITDHLEWGDDDEFNKLHMFLLQEKVNGYLGFIESGDIYKDYPNARGKEIIIRVVAKYP